MGGSRDNTVIHSICGDILLIEYVVRNNTVIQSIVSDIYVVHN
jgi:hypothetical protein